MSDISAEFKKVDEGVSLSLYEHVGDDVILLDERWYTSDEWEDMERATVTSW